MFNKRKYKKKNNETKRILASYKIDTGYLRIKIRNLNNKEKSVYVHRLIAKTWILNSNDKPTVNQIF